jgi:hypothetical protein
MNTDKVDETGALRSQLEEVLNAASMDGQKIVQKGHAISIEGQNVVDWADATKDISREIDDPNKLSELLRIWQIAGRSAHLMDTQLSNESLFVHSSTIYAASACSMIVFSGYKESEIVKSKAAQHLRDLAARPQEYISTVNLLKELGLDQARGTFINAYEQFETANKAFLVNASSANQATTWLIPMRECILTVLDIIIKQTSPQKRVKGVNNKVMHILQLKARQGCDESHLKNLAEESDQLVEKHLTPSKQRSISRQDGERIFLSAMLWLKSFLSLIDPEKMNKAAR